MPIRERADPRDAPGLQLSWVAAPGADGDGHVMAWQPQANAYGGNIQASIRSSLGSSAAVGAGDVRVARLRLPDGPMSVMCQRLDTAALAGLARIRALDAGSSPSVAWFGGVFRLATQLVRAGRVRPWLREHRDPDGRSTWWVAGWAPLGVDLEALGPELAASMPPVVGAAEGLADPADVPAQVLTAFVDQIARGSLQHTGWRPPITDTRRPAARAVRAVARALSAPGPRFHPDRDLIDELRLVAQTFEHAALRAAGRPVVRARLRLGLPVGAGDWPLSLELVDVDDPGRWCTAAELVTGEPAALALAGEPQWQGLLEQTLRTARDDLSAAAPWLVDWLAGDGHLFGEAPAAGTIDVDAAAATLESVDLLRGLGIELITPEQLTRRTPRSAGTARPAHESAGRFGAKTLVDWKVVVDDTPVDEAILQRAVEAGSQLVEAGGRWVQIGRAEARRALEQLAQHRVDHGELSTIGVLRLAAELDAETDEPEAGSDAGGHRALVGTEWLHELLAGLPEATVEEAVEPAGFTATLRPYQRRGLGWLQFLHRVGLGGCLADDMGLGKTPTTLAHLAAIPGPHLVVCPLSVVRNWQNECAKFVPLARVMVHHGTGRADAARLTELVAEHDIVITTYQVAARDIDAIAATTWSVAVFDEAQAVKNPETRTAKAMRKVPAGQHIALTGTPVENRLSELWSIFELVAPGLLGSQAQFRSRFALPIERHGDQAAAAALRQLTGPFLLRRTKADRSLVPDLPDKVEQIAWAALTREQAAMYQSVVDQLLTDAQQASGMKRRGLVLAALTRLKQICNHPAHALGDGSRLGGRSGKLTRFDELVADLLDAGERALVFTQFREMGLLLQRHLHERFDLTVPFLHGGVTRSGRDRMVDEFQSGASPSPLLLVSLKAGGTGLNLTAASRVVHYDRWWNPAVEDQATDRAWRIGQHQAVFVHKLVCQGTIEERVDTLINDKRALAEAVVGTSGEAWLSELSTDELRDLVTLHPGAHT